MASTQLKSSRNWNTVMKRISIVDPSSKKAFNPPSYSHVYRLKTVPQSKDNFSWFGWSIAAEGRVQDMELYKMAKSMSVAVKQGLVRVSAPPQEHETIEQEDEEKVPF